MSTGETQRIALLVGRFIPALGGLESWAHDLAVALVARGHEHDGHWDRQRVIRILAGHPRPRDAAHRDPLHLTAKEKLNDALGLPQALPRPSF